MKIALVLMPSRKSFAEKYIIPYLPHDLEIIERPDLGLSDVHELAWSQVQGDDWGMVLHDDIILCDDFMDTLKSKLIESADRRFISLYSPRKTALLSMEKGKAWHRDAPSSFLGEEAIIMRGDLIEEYLDWLPEGRLKNRVWYDEQLQMFLRDLREPVWICVPNLIDHATDILPSLVGHPAMCFGKSRRSTTFSRRRNIYAEHEPRNTTKG
ncbi:MAG: hypothetical protein ACXQTY_06495 [Candidatus Methanogasteraceae archaeon]